MSSSHDTAPHFVEPYCTHCGYDFVGLPILRCPECGRHYDERMYDLRPLDVKAEACERKLMRGPTIFAAVVFVVGVVSQVVPAAGALMIACLLIVPPTALLAWRDASRCVRVSTLRRRLVAREPLHTRDSIQIAFVLTLQAYVAAIYGMAAGGIGSAIGYGAHCLLMAAW